MYIDYYENTVYSIHKGVTILHNSSLAKSFLGFKKLKQNLLCINMLQEKWCKIEYASVHLLSIFSWNQSKQEKSQ